MKSNSQIKPTRKIEAEINKHLYRICGLVTIVVMAMMTIEFFTRGAFPPSRISLFYLGILIIYSFHKELVRWLGKRLIERQGEYFVYSWIGLTLLLYLINFFSKNYFIYSPQEEFLPILSNFTILTLEVLGIFILTRGLKLLKFILIKEPKK